MVDLSKVTEEDAERALDRVRDRARHGRDLTEAERALVRAERRAEAWNRSGRSRGAGLNAWKRDRGGDAADREAYILPLFEDVMRTKKRPPRGWNPTNLAKKVQPKLDPLDREKGSGYGVTTLRTKVIPSLIRDGKLKAVERLSH